MGGMEGIEGRHGLVQLAFDLSGTLGLALGQGEGVYGLGGLLQGTVIGRSIGPQSLGLRAEVGQPPLLDVRVVTLGLQHAQLLPGVGQFLFDLRQF